MSDSNIRTKAQLHPMTLKYFTEAQIQMMLKMQPKRTEYKKSPIGVWGEVFRV
jgi:hypothetical protein